MYDIPPAPSQNDVNEYIWKEWFRQVRDRLINLTNSNFGTAAPVAGTYTKGSVVVNSNKTELGTVGNKYVIQEWLCTVAGTPGTWVQVRTLTGN